MRSEFSGELVENVTVDVFIDSPAQNTRGPGYSQRPNLGPQLLAGTVELLIDLGLRRNLEHVLGPG